MSKERTCRQDCGGTFRAEETRYAKVQRSEVEDFCLGILQNSDSGASGAAGSLCLARSSWEKRQPRVSYK